MYKYQEVASVFRKDLSIGRYILHNFGIRIYLRNSWKIIVLHEKKYMVFFSYSNNMANFEAFLPVVVGYFIMHKLIFSKYLMIIFDDFSIVNLVLATVTCHLKLKSGHISRFFTAVNIKHASTFRSFLRKITKYFGRSPLGYILIYVFLKRKN